ncbi:glycosyltransferase family 4 protein (plasmid) [Pedobacter sp. BS3]|uniref:glycosyltransferase family 4 protein n=1 Tax=Pedobacter sp. BS3 TaxID=2567937 RepID=UPI0011EFFF5E|nr:glycosyltransferase family 4 protein [Pedobacter sp. BS3]TZF86187.1 glycosyltransferase family 4 protein [Pedobacter sp. BS3]
MKKVLFAGLSAFAHTGGIEKVNRNWLKVLSQLAEQDGIRFSGHILADRSPDERYINNRYFKGYQRQRFRFLFATCRQALRSDIIIISHVHLAPLVVFIKKLCPSIKIYLHAHGIEVWHSLNRMQLQALRLADKILAVSRYTRQQLIEQHQVPGTHIEVWPNALDVFFYVPDNLNKPAYLLERYGLSSTQKVLLTVTRLSSEEQYKGYDKVIQALPYLLKQYPGLVYLVVGKADPAEQQRVNILIEDAGLQHNVKLLGYVDEQELVDHYLLADSYVMPSTGEGFGIAFIEATACGRPVLAGNSDGSADAVLPQTGLLCDSDNPDNLLKKLRELQTFPQSASTIQEATVKQYGFDAYRQRIEQLILSE